MAAALQFGRRDPGVDYPERPTAFGLVFHDQKLACVRVERARSYYDLPGGAVEAGETEEEALIREFLEETGMTVRPVERIAEAGQYFRKSDTRPMNNIGGLWIAEMIALNPAVKVEADHELVWLHPRTALAELRHDAHAWAVAKWLRT
ncbi:NUDIX domain-containing protein [Brevundimonas goettingensis]|uniref:NUDIX domain-containing protein n=1 Tax=Brevundimonas goettingensis TaxID=2774190 RepID=A0A975C2Y7_9CAUL|nr:NUDIX domain-containing protein [Brevundimonas goettingensis]QTC91892.1 NUDIX domain-containing protein [Brevundimonas goettingensis]